MELVGAVEHDLAFLADGVGMAVVDVEGCVEPDPGVTVLEVVPGEERLAVLGGVVNDPNRSGNSGRYFRVRKWASL